MKAARSSVLFTLIISFVMIVFFTFVIVTDMVDQWTRSTPVSAKVTEAETSVDSVTVGVDYYGSYNGHFLSPAADSWSYLSDDGWSLDTQSGDDGFFLCTNNKYDGAILMVRGSSITSTTNSEIMDYGFYSYSIDVSGASTAPQMTFNGITWGASDDVVTAAYGEPNSTKTTSTYTLYSYDLGGATMTFYVYFGSGLQKVALTI